MTREEAIRAIEYVIEDFKGVGNQLVGPGQSLVDALTTLAPAVRYEPPTVEEVGDNEKCWVWKRTGRSWERHEGRLVRVWWNGHLGTMAPHFTAWLPYSAIPEGGA